MNQSFRKRNIQLEKRIPLTVENTSQISLQYTRAIGKAMDVEDQLAPG
jgi:hypothetical protein